MMTMMTGKWIMQFPLRSNVFRCLLDDCSYHFEGLNKILPVFATQLNQQFSIVLDWIDERDGRTDQQYGKDFCRSKECHQDDYQAVLALVHSI